MRRFLMGAVIFLLPTFAQRGFASDIDVRDAVVELRIEFAPPPSSEIKRQRSTMAKTQTGKAICSGVFINKYGGILTAKHCVDGAKAISAVTRDGREYSAKVLRLSESQDIAVIAIGLIGSPYLGLAQSQRTGESVAIFGSPLGITGVITTGIISKILGDITVLDCTAVPGNSGGPVLNENNEIVGIVSAMVVVIAGPAHLTVVQSLDSLYAFFLGF